MMACLLCRIGIHADVRYGAVSARWQGLGTSLVNQTPIPQHWVYYITSTRKEGLGTLDTVPCHNGMQCHMKSMTIIQLITLLCRVTPARAQRAYRYKRNVNAYTLRAPHFNAFLRSQHTESCDRCTLIGSADIPVGATERCPESPDSLSACW